MVFDGKVGAMEEQAMKRKERLKALKRKQEGASDGSEKPEDTGLPKPKFRSYKPQDDALKVNLIPDAKPGDVQSEVRDQLEAGKSRVVIEELDITNLAPRKPDWDLKRDVSKKLDKLEKRTQKAIAELIRDRLKAGQEDLLSLVNVGAITNQTKGKDDE